MHSVSDVLNPYETDMHTKSVSDMQSCWHAHMLLTDFIFLFIIPGRRDSVFPSTDSQCVLWGAKKRQKYLVKEYIL